MARKGQKFDKYDEDFIMKVIEERFNGNSTRFLAKKHSIPRGTIETWVYKYRHTGTIAKQKLGRPKQSDEANYKEKYEILKKFLESLEEGEQEKK